ncbi:MAG: hypothetical protein WBG16_03160 [Bradyrhizobium sp.]|uniref:hypothetical protein n=1 Tax=Bradyrhizobium sp. TaxID=376 RepID=UPI003C70A872
MRHRQNGYQGIIPANAIRAFRPAFAATNVAQAEDCGPRYCDYGDTIEIHGTRIRLFEIDAPESAQLSEDASSKSYRCRQKAANELADYLEGYAEASAVNSGEAGGDPGVQNGEDEGDAGADEEEEDRPLSDTLVRDLPAHRTLGVRLGLLVQPDVAIIAVATGLRRTRLLDAIRRDLRSSG